MKKNEILAVVSQTEQKYFNLVWYVRSYKNRNINEVKEKRESLEKLFPNEIENLINSKSPDWHHGFNSGMLAGMRYVLDLYTQGIDFANEDFPNLDS